MGSYTKSMTPTNFPNAPTHVLSRPPSTTPLYSHSSPVPTPSLPPLPISIPTFNSNPRSDGASPTHSNGHAANGNGGVEATVKEEEGGEFDPETVPKDLKKEGSDWLTMFNPNVKRVLDVGLVHTLVHDS
jgi:glucose repression regulatory protein TUP1